MHEICIQEKERELGNKIKQLVEKYQDEVVAIANEYAEHIRQSKIPFGSKERETQINKILHGVFNPSFLTEIVFNLDVLPEKIIKVEDLKPYCCNFPAELTRRSKGDRGLQAPCRKRLGKNDLYFCTLGSHRAYALKLGLPVTRADADRRNIPYPKTKPVGIDPRPPHVRMRKKKKIAPDGVERMVEKHVLQRVPIDSEKESTSCPFPSIERKDAAAGEAMATTETMVATEATVETTKRKRKSHLLDEIPRYQCVHMCPFTRATCTRDALYVDEFAGNAAFCSKHIAVSEEDLENMEEEIEKHGTISESAYDDFKRIFVIDSELIDGDAHRDAHGDVRCRLKFRDDLTPEQKHGLSKERYILATRYGLGTHPDVVSLFSSDISTTTAAPSEISSSSLDFREAR